MKTFGKRSGRTVKKEPRHTGWDRASCYAWGLGLL